MTTEPKYTDAQIDEAYRAFQKSWADSDRRDKKSIRRAMRKAIDSLPERQSSLAALPHLDRIKSDEVAVPVAWVADLAPGIERPKEYMGIFTPHKNYADHLAKHPDYVVTPLYTQPARSGVVRDEDVEAACRVNYESDGNSKWDKLAECWKVKHRTAMRAALEHFAKGERHE